MGPTAGTEAAPHERSESLLGVIVALCRRSYGGRASLWAVVVALVAAGCSGEDSTSGDPGPSGAAKVHDWLAEIAPPGSGRPGAPTPRVCGSDVLAGPETVPDGAITVSTTQDIGDVVETSEPGSTFWLEPGLHLLDGGEFDQVIPHAGDTFVGAPGAVLDGAAVSRYAFTGTAPDVTIAHLTVQNFGSTGSNHNEGVVNHDSAPGWTVVSNTIRRNGGAGVMLGSRNTVAGNCLQENGQYGFNAYHREGVNDVELRGNEIVGNNTDDWEKRLDGCGCTGGGKFWATINAVVADNYVHDNHGTGLWADTNNSAFAFQRNYIADNDGMAVFYETSYNAHIVENTMVGNGWNAGPENPGFPTGAVYLSESGGDTRAPGDSDGVLLVAQNLFQNNWSGVIAWENADRFAGSPANTSSGSGTLVNPEVTLAGCSDPEVLRTEPFLDDCRWKTQNVMVKDNQFILERSAVPDCRAATGCGFNGVFSNYGTYPDWSPYKGTTVAENIALRQNNVWRGNHYRGPWNFVAPSQGDVLLPDQWQSAPFLQDQGSTFEP